MRRIKLMADYGCWPLWEAGPEVGNIAPETLPLSPGLRVRLAAWAERYDRCLNRDDPAASAWAPSDSAEAFDREGRRLWGDLRAELGEDFAVLYFSETEGRLLEP